jgi:hypothetical protein
MLGTLGQRIARGVLVRKRQEPEVTELGGKVFMEGLLENQSLSLLREQTQFDPFGVLPRV